MITNIVIAIGSLFLLALLAELVLRIYYRYRGKIYVWEPFQKIKLVLDNSALPQLPPVSYLKVNSFGELGDEPPSAGCCRILIVGGSAAECYFLGTDKGLTGALQKSLSKENMNAHVGSIAASGIGADVLSDIIEGVFSNYNSLDLIICMVGGNDLVRWFGNSAPASGEKLPINSETFLSVNQRRIYSLKSLKSSAIFELLKWIKIRYVREKIIKKNAGHRLHALRSMRSGARKIRKTTGDPRLFLEQYENNLTSVLLQCRKKAERVIVIPQPWFNCKVSDQEALHFWNAAQGRPFHENVETYFSLDVFSNGMNMVGASTKNVAVKLGVETVDLNNKIPYDFEHMYDFLHFTDLGVKKIADVISNKITLTAQGE